MTPDLFYRENHNISRGQAISCSRCVDNDYKKGGIMIIITQMALMARSANDQLGRDNGKAVHKENTKNAKLLHAVVLGASKRCKLNMQQAKYNV